MSGLRRAVPDVLVAMAVMILALGGCVGSRGQSQSPESQASSPASSGARTISDNAAPSPDASAAQRAPVVPSHPLSAEDTRKVAADFLGCDPATLRMADRQPAPKEYSWGRCEYVAWTGQSSPTSRPRVPVDVKIERLTGIVAGADWHYPAESATGASAAGRPAEGEAQRLAGTLIRDRAGFAVKDSEVQVVSNGAGFTCTARGAMLDGRRYFANVMLDAAPLRVRAYGAGLLPPEPPAASPVRLTEAQALEAARHCAETVRGWKVSELRVRQLTTSGYVGKAGTPVYIVDMRRAYDPNHPTRTEPRMLGVDATTGEIIDPPAGMK